MAQSGDRKILRIGISQNGNLVEERLLRKRGPVTIGEHQRNLFMLPHLPRVGASHTLFDLQGDQFYVRLKPFMEGRVLTEAGPLDFEALRTQKRAQKQGEDWLYPISEDSRGRIVIEDATVLFQFVAPPPPPSKQLLSAGAQGGGPLQGVDWPFANIMLFSAILQVAFVLFLGTQDLPETPNSLDQLSDRWAQMLVDKRETPPPPPSPMDEMKQEENKLEPIAVEPVKPKPEKPKEPKETPKEEPQIDPDTPEGQQAAQEARKKEIAAKVKQHTILSHLGTKGGDGPGSVLDTLTQGAAMVGMEEAFSGTSGLAVAQSADDVRDARRKIGGEGGTGAVATIDSGKLAAKAPSGPVTSGKKGKEVQVSGVVNVRTPSEAIGTGVLSTAEIAKTVNRRKGAVKDCYERQLKRNPSLEGAVRIQFTIEPSGRVSRTQVLENTTRDAALATCIAGKIKSWRFAKPDGGSVTVAFPFVFAPAK